MQQAACSIVSSWGFRVREAPGGMGHPHGSNEAATEFDADFAGSPDADEFWWPWVKLEGGACEIPEHGVVHTFVRVNFPLSLVWAS